MSYNWKDVAVSVMFSLVMGIIFSGFAVGLAKYLADPQYAPAAKLVGVSLVLWGAMSYLLLLVTTWDDGITVWTHGWVLKVANVVGKQVALLTPFVVCWFIF